MEEEASHVSRIEGEKEELKNLFKLAIFNIVY